MNITCGKVLNLYETEDWDTKVSRNFGFFTSIRCRSVFFIFCFFCFEYYVRVDF